MVFTCPPATSRRATSSPANRFSRNTKDGFFHRACARDTQSETSVRTAAHAARSLLSCALWRGMGRLWRGMGGRRPPHRQHGLLGFHQPRDTQHGFPCPSGDSKESNPKPDQRVFTNHETRNTNHGFFSNHVFPTRDFPRFPTISRHFPAPPPPSAVLARLPGARRQPQLPPPSGLVPLRPTHDEPMLRKENIPDCTNSGTFYLALAFARLESPLRSGHHRGQRRSVTVRGVTRSTTGRGLQRRNTPSGQETISKRR